MTDIAKIAEGRAQMLADTMLGQYHRGTYSPERIAALKAFPPDGRPIRATVYMRHMHFKRLLNDGLIEGVAGDASITPLGEQVRAYLMKGESE